jgi:hypothetical protein
METFHVHSFVYALRVNNNAGQKAPLPNFTPQQPT